MKKGIAIITILLMFFALTYCSKEETAPRPDSETETAEEQQEESEEDGETLETDNAGAGLSSVDEKIGRMLIDITRCGPYQFDCETYTKPDLFYNTGVRLPDFKKSACRNGSRRMIGKVTKTPILADGSITILFAPKST